MFPVLQRWLGIEGRTPDGMRYLPAHLSSNLWGYGTPPLSTTWGDSKAEPINGEFSDYVEGGLKSNGIISAIETVRFSVFAEARFQFQQLVGGRPGDRFDTPDLGVLERPWVGGTTGDLLAGMLLDADFGGNAYRIRVGEEIVRLRPDWVEIVVGERVDPLSDPEEDLYLGYVKLGYLYWHGGKQSAREPSYLTLDQVAHFAPYPDPNANFRGMSWLTPVIREIQSDKLATEHKAKFFENAATPNLHVGMKEAMPLTKFEEYIDKMEERHAGALNAYKTLYTAAGADVTVLGQNMQQLDYKAIIGAGETRLAAAAGVHPVIVGLSEGMQGSSLNAGNYTAAKRRFVDATMRPLWRNVAGSLETLVPPSGGTRLWYDDRDIAFLREDIQDRANVQMTAATTIRQLVDAGYEPESVVKAVNAEDMTLLQHSGLFSVQLQPPGTVAPVPEAPRTEVTIAEGAVRNEFTLPERQTVVEVDATTTVAEGAVQNHNETTVPERQVTVENNVEAPAAPVSRSVRKTVETDETGRITAIVEEEG